MLQPFKVWDLDLPQIGDAVIASFADFGDATLFAAAKAKKEGGYRGTIWVGTEYESRTQFESV